MDTVKNFSGKVLFLDRADINTDEIIAAKYLTEITREALKPGHLYTHELRLRLVPRARALGPGGKRYSSGCCRKLCTHLQTKHVQLRNAGRRAAGSNH